jgi:hypothetical protein
MAMAPSMLWRGIRQILPALLALAMIGGLGCKYSGRSEAVFVFFPLFADFDVQLAISLLNQRTTTSVIRFRGAGSE